MNTYFFIYFSLLLFLSTLFYSFQCLAYILSNLSLGIPNCFMLIQVVQFKIFNFQLFTANIQKNHIVIVSDNFIKCTVSSSSIFWQSPQDFVHSQSHHLPLNAPYINEVSPLWLLGHELFPLHISSTCFFPGSYFPGVGSLPHTHALISCQMKT